MRTPALAALTLLLVFGAWLASRGGETVAISDSGPARSAIQESSTSELVGGKGREVQQVDRSEAAPLTEPGVASAGRGLQEFTGRVVDLRGRPVSGTEVLARDGERTLAEAGFAGEILGRVWTGLEGSFSLELGFLPAGHALTLIVREPGYAPLDHALVTDGLELQAVGDLVLDPGVILSGTVLDPKGAEVEGARILIEEAAASLDLFIDLAGAEGEALDETGPDGLFEINCQASGPWSFRITHPSYPDLVVSGEAPDPGTVLTGLRWTLAPGEELSGVVEGLPPGPVGGVSVAAMPLGPGGMLDIEHLRGRRTSPLQADGTFSVGGLVPGETYQVQALRREDGPRLSAPVTDSIEAVSGEQDLRLIWSVEASVRFQVQDAVSGRPVEVLGVRYGYGFQRPALGPQGVPRGYFKDGVVELADIRPQEELGLLLVGLTAPGYTGHSFEVKVRAGERLDLGRITLAPASRLLTVTVLDQGSAPVEGASVLLRPARGPSDVTTRIQVGEGVDPERMAFPGEVTAQHGYTDSSGRIRLSTPADERVDLVVRASGFAPMVRADLALPAVGNSEELVRLTAGGSVQIRTLDASGTPAPGRAVEHRRPIGLEQLRLAPPRRSGSDATLTVRFLEPGRHWFRIQEQDGGPLAIGLTMGMDGGEPQAEEGWASLDVAPGEGYELDLRLAAKGRLHGRVTEGGEVLPGAQVTLERQLDFAPPGMPGAGTSSSTSSQGLFAFEGVRVGSYTLVVNHPARALSNRIEVLVEAGDQEQDVDLPRCSVSGRVLDDQGQPLVGARVTAQRAQVEGGSQSVAVVGTSGGGLDVFTSLGGEAGFSGVLTDEDGRYVLSGLPSGESLQAEARLSGRQTNRSAAFELEFGEQRAGVDVQLPEGGQLRVSVDLPEITMPMMAMALFMGEGTNPGPQIAVLGGEDVLFEDLPAGAWSVRLQLMGPPTEGQEIPEPQMVEVIAGQETLVEFRP